MADWTANARCYHAPINDPTNGSIAVATEITSGDRNLNKVFRPVWPIITGTNPK